MADRDAATGLLEAFDSFSPPHPDGRVPKLGIVQTVTGVTCRILFDGETVTGGKSYPCLSSYVPIVADRVVLFPVGSKTSWLVLGAIGAAGTDVRTSGAGGFVAQSPNGTYWRLTPSDSGASVWTAI